MGFNWDIFVQKKVLRGTILCTQCIKNEAQEHRVKFGLILKKTDGRLLLK